jgi:hypothetical protein
MLSFGLFFGGVELEDGGLACKPDSGLVPSLGVDAAVTPTELHLIHSQIVILTSVQQFCQIYSNFADCTYHCDICS